MDDMDDFSIAAADTQEKSSGSIPSSNFRRLNTIDMIAKAKEDPSLKHSDMPKFLELNEGVDEKPYSKVLVGNEDLAAGFMPVTLEDHLGEEAAAIIPTPIKITTFMSRRETVITDIISHISEQTVTREFLRAGPREKLAFEPKHVKAAIVTCGGLCPGLNTVVREIFMCLTMQYGVEEIYGVPFGYCGFYSPNFEIRKLEISDVEFVHREGGSFLGSSRGGHDTKMIVDALEDYGFNQVYIIGGDGTHRGAIVLYEEIKRRRLKISVIGIPKTIDNDIALIDKSFGFDTAVEESQLAISSAKTEASSALFGIGLVKLMGREAGHIAMQASLASREVDICLIPEVPFILEGEHGLLKHIEHLLKTKGHCVIVVAEGAGMDLLKEKLMKAGTDASGNVKLPDIGLWMKEIIVKHFADKNMTINLKYMNPMYMIRTVPANASDSLYCSMLSANAVHGAMAGYTGFTVGLINTHFVYIPMNEIVQEKIKVDKDSIAWHRVTSMTGQPDFN